MISSHLHEDFGNLPDVPAFGSPSLKTATKDSFADNLSGAAIVKGKTLSSSPEQTNPPTLFC